MFNCLKENAFHWLLPKLLEKKSPNSIPRSGEDGKKMDCYTIYLQGDEEKPQYLVNSYNPATGILNVLAPDTTGRYDVPQKISLRQAFNIGIQIYHYYGLWDIYYKSVLEAVFNQVIPLDKLRIRFRRLISWASQSYFNKRTLRMKEGHELLIYILEWQLRNTSSISDIWGSSKRSGISTFMLMTNLYSERWINHPNSAKEMAKLELYLETLQKSEEIKQIDGLYYVTGKALRTIEAYEESNRRHDDLQTIQLLLLILTFFVVIGTFQQAKLINLPPIAEWPTHILYFLYHVYNLL